jgi:hypothetical protein
MSLLRFFCVSAALIGIFCVEGHSTILFNANPYVGEGYMAYSGGPYYPSQQQLEAQRQIVQSNVVWGNQVQMTPNGPQQVQVFGVVPQGAGYQPQQQSSYYSSQGSYYQGY